MYILQTHTVVLKRDPEDDLGFSIAGGVGSTAFSPHDPGIFISKVVDGGQADKQGNIKVGDKVLSVSGKCSCFNYSCTWLIKLNSLLLK